MKRLIYITYLGLLALFLIACDKENVAPEAATQNASLSDLRFGGSCSTYSYQTKNGTVHFGNTRGDYAIVGFKPNVTPAQQQTILSRFSFFDTTDGDAFFESGVATVVKFLPGTNCQQVDLFSKQLEQHPGVDYVLPVFNGTGVFSQYDWISPSPELTVTLKHPQHYRFLEQFARSTKTQIVTGLDDVTFIVAANKKSTGTILELASQLNASPKFINAEPNFYGQFSGMKHGRLISGAIAGTSVQQK